MAFPFAGFVVGYLASPTEASESFYTATAEVIPVLLLVLAVELRFFRLRELPMPSVPRRRSMADTLEAAERSFVPLVRALTSIATLAVLALGEFAALHALGPAGPESGNPRLVYGAISAGIGALAALSILGEGSRERESGEGPDSGMPGH